MKFRDKGVQKFFATIINISDEFNFYEVSKQWTRYEDVFCSGYIDGKKFMFVLQNYKMCNVALLIQDASTHIQLIQNIWERCVSK